MDQKGKKISPAKKQLKETMEESPDSLLV